MNIYTILQYIGMELQNISNIREVLAKNGLIYWTRK